MKKIVIILFILLSQYTSEAQKKPSASQVNNMMKKAMKEQGMTKEEQAEMNELMNSMAGMPDLELPYNSYPIFTDNTTLLPARKNSIIASIGKSLKSNEEVKAKAIIIFNKVMAKAPVEEKQIINQALSKVSGADNFESVAIASLLKGHPLAALALAAHAVKTDPSALVYQNNLAAILTQSGYPEQSIPILKKLENQLPKNSSILTNLGYAWFYLGEKDTSKLYMGKALKLNPQQAAASVGAGVISEVSGDPQKSATELENGFISSLDQFSANLIKNNNGKNAHEELTFDKIKSKISIYEYVKDDWIKCLPIYSYSCDLDKLKENTELRMGFSNMLEKYHKYNKIWDDTITNYDNYLATRVGKETTAEKLKYVKERPDLLTKQLLNSARVILDIIQKERVKLEIEWQKETFAELEKELADHYSKGAQTQYDGESDCEMRRRLECEFLPDYNSATRIKAVQKLEQIRLVVNAELTWSWYVNFFETETLAVAHQFEDIFNPFVELIENANEKFIMPSFPCDFGQYKPVARATPMPPLPQLECQIVVSIPSGMNFTELAGAKGSGNNSAVNIKTSTTNPVPNVQIGMGLDKTNPSEPGSATTPYIQSSNGNVQAMNIQNNEADELAPLAKITGNDVDELAPLANIKGADPDELAPLANIKSADPDELAPLANIKGDAPDELAPLANIKIDDIDALNPLLNVQQLAVIKLLHDLMSDCKNLHKYTPQEIKDLIKKQIITERTAIDNGINNLVKAINRQKKAQQSNAAKSNSQQLDNLSNNLQSLQKNIQSIDINKVGNDGIVPTIVNNMQANIQAPINGLFK